MLRFIKIVTLVCLILTRKTRYCQTKPKIYDDNNSTHAKILTIGQLSYCTEPNKEVTKRESG